jgi:hypothetical protein
MAVNANVRAFHGRGACPASALSKDPLSWATHSQQSTTGLRLLHPPLQRILLRLLRTPLLRLHTLRAPFSVALRDRGPQPLEQLAPHDPAARVRVPARKVAAERRAQARHARRVRLEPRGDRDARVIVGRARVRFGCGRRRGRGSIGCALELLERRRGCRRHGSLCSRKRDLRDAHGEVGHARQVPVVRGDDELEPRALERARPARRDHLRAPRSASAFAGNGGAGRAGGHARGAPARRCAGARARRARLR